VDLLKINTLRITYQTCTGYCDLFVMFNDGTNHMMPRAHKDNDHDGISVQVTKTNLILQVGQSNGFADVTGYAILKYIKTN
jgi:hypothetical protein